MISLRRRKQLLLCILAVEAACIVAAVALALLADVEAPEAPPPFHAAPLPAQCVPIIDEGDQAYSAIYQSNLRQPLFDAPAAATTATVAASVTLSMRLVGTVLEANYSYAVFRGGAGEVATLAVGESQGGICVLSVGDGNAVVRFGGRSVTLSVGKEENR